MKFRTLFFSSFFQFQSLEENLSVLLGNHTVVGTSTNINLQGEHADLGKRFQTQLLSVLLKMLKSVPTGEEEKLEKLKLLYGKALRLNDLEGVQSLYSIWKL